MYCLCVLLVSCPPVCDFGFGLCVVLGSGRAFTVLDVFVFTAVIYC